MVLVILLTPTGSVCTRRGVQDASRRRLRPFATTTTMQRAASAAAQLSSSLSYVPVINGRDRRAATRSSSSFSNVRVIKERHRRLRLRPLISEAKNSPRQLRDPTPPPWRRRRQTSALGVATMTRMCENDAGRMPTRTSSSCFPRLRLVKLGPWRGSTAVAVARCAV